MLDSEGTGPTDCWLEAVDAAETLDEKLFILSDAVCDCPSVPVWLKYIDLQPDLRIATAAKESIAGSWLDSGHLIWRRYVEMLPQDQKLAGWLEWLATPHIDQSKFEGCPGFQGSLDDDILGRVKQLRRKTGKLVQPRLKWEEKLASATDGTRQRLLREYLEWELENYDANGVVDFCLQLFERILTSEFPDTEIWSRYIYHIWIDPISPANIYFTDADNTSRATACLDIVRRKSYMHKKDPKLLALWLRVLQSASYIQGPSAEYEQVKGGLAEIESQFQELRNDPQVLLAYYSWVGSMVRRGHGNMFGELSQDIDEEMSSLDEAAAEIMIPFFSELLCGTMSHSAELGRAYFENFSHGFEDSMSDQFWSAWLEFEIARGLNGDTAGLFKRYVRAHDNNLSAQAESRFVRLMASYLEKTGQAIGLEKLKSLLLTKHITAPVPKRSNSDVKDAVTVFIKGFDRSLTKDQLKAALPASPELISLALPHAQEDKKLNRGFAFLRYCTIDDATIACERLNGSPIGNSTILARVDGTESHHSKSKPGKSAATVVVKPAVSNSALEQYGKIVNSSLSGDKLVVEFTTEQEAGRACLALNGQTVDVGGAQAILKVELLDSKRPGKRTRY